MGGQRVLKDEASEAELCLAPLHILHQFAQAVSLRSRESSR